MMKIRLRGKQINTTIIQCYAPTNDNVEETKDAFYEQLQHELDSALGHDMKIVMGDLNAKVGDNNSGYDRAMGRYGCGVMNENGERLVEFCSLNNLVIGGTLFQHKDIHKLTWYSPNGRDRNQIDHIMINGMWRRSLQDVRVMRGADAASDHHLVLAVFQVKLRKTGVSKVKQPRYDIDKLEDLRIRGTFVLELRNRFQVLVDLEDTQEEQDKTNKEWERVKTAYHKASETCLGTTKRERKEWMTEGTWQTIEKRREVKRQCMAAKSDRLKERSRVRYKEMNRLVKRKSRADKRAFIDNLASQAEEAAKAGEQGNVYKLTRMISGKYSKSSELPIEDKDGKLLTTEAEQDARWAEHFEEVLNRPTPITEADIQEAVCDLDIDIYPPTRAEIIQAIKSLKNGKAPGLDNLNAELFKTDPELAADILHPLFIDIWEGKKVPDDWSQGIIIKLPKKGSLRKCSNWRGITLLSVPSKILAKVIIQRLTRAVDEQLRPEQAGFRRERGKEQDNITKTALHWTPEGRRKRGRPKNTWRRTVEREMRDLNHTWGTLQRLAMDRINNGGLLLLPYVPMA
ncbi:uncharacterized protein [Diadema antillarum]|uniref:uncharacterized protein n=1 Tax=Diadema antillarum TaxID=105358 RepID=UPI003A887F31